MRSLPSFRRHRGENSHQKSRGQSLVEFALVLPVFLLCLAGALDLGRVFFANISLNNAAREGAFQAAKQPAAFGAGQVCDGSPAGSIVCRVQFEARNTQVAISSNDITSTCNLACFPIAGSTVTVTVKGQFALVTPILSAVFGGSTVPLTSRAVAQIEYCNGTVCANGVATPPPSPSADFFCSPTTFIVNGSTICTDTSSGSPAAWSWDFGDGTDVQTEQSPVHQYTVAGTYTVRMTAINITGSSTTTRNNYIHVLAFSTPTPAPTGATPTPAPTPNTTTCVHPPNVIGDNPGTADAKFSNLALNNHTSWAGYFNYSDLATGPKNKIQTQNVDATQCVIINQTTIKLHWRLP
jgi:PKD repeat protein